MPPTVGLSRTHRPAPSRLPVALGFATFVVAALLQLLALLLEPAACSAPRCNNGDTGLTVLLEQPAAVPRDLPAPKPNELNELNESTNPVNSINPPAAKPAADTPNLAAADVEASAPGKLAARDWNSIAAKTSRQQVIDHFRKERAQASRWEKSRSVMFEPSADVVSAAIVDPLLADLQELHFRAPVGVLGLGVTLGNCFIGLPLLGVPLEQRSTSGITLVVCATESL